MDTLIIHPRDPSTDFLRPIYQDNDCATVVRGGVTRADLMDLIEDHDQTIMMGHGSPAGLFGMWQFGAYMYAVDYSFADLLAETDATYIWCYASDFVEDHGLGGFATGMFISEPGEARALGVKADDWEIDFSNDAFARVVADATGPEMFRAAYERYMPLASVNPVAAYNAARLRYYARPSAERRTSYDETLNRRSSWPNGSESAVRRTANMGVTRSRASAIAPRTGARLTVSDDWLGI